MLLVTVAEAADGRPTRPGAIVERDAVLAAVGQASSPAAMTQLNDSSASAAAVRRELGRHCRAHFACHGDQNLIECVNLAAANLLDPQVATAARRILG
jgi:hypothetical protein